MSETRPLSQAEIETQVERIYAEEIQPELQVLESERLSALSKIMWRLSILALSTVVAVGLLLQSLQGIILGVLVFCLAPLIGGVYVAMVNKSYRIRLKGAVIRPICRALGDLRYRPAYNNEMDINQFTALGLLPANGLRNLEDVFLGSHRSVGFRMVEAKLESGGKYSTIIFQGLLFEIEVPRDFSGCTVMVADRGPVGNSVMDFVKKHFKAMQRIALESDSFERRFQVYSDDPPSADALLTPSFLAAMLALEPDSFGRPFSAAFAKGRFLLALSLGKESFELGGLLTPVKNAESRLRDRLREITAAHRLIDHLQGDRPGDLV